MFHLMGSGVVVMFYLVLVFLIRDSVGTGYWVLCLYFVVLCLCLY